MNDATLSFLVPSTGLLNPDFSADITDYTVAVPNSVTNLIVTGMTSDTKATMDPPDGNLSFTNLTVGTSAEQTIKVVSEDGKTTKEYKVKVLRESNITTLSDLIISAGTLSPAFNPYTIRYTVTVPNNVTNLIVKGRTSNVGVTIDPPDGNLYFMNLTAGLWIRKTITVASEYKAITKVYMVRVLRQYKTSYTSENIGELMFIPAGSFQRDEGEENISVISKPYYLGKYPITRQQFLDIMGAEPSYTEAIGGMNSSVHTINWYHAIAFCNKLSIKEGLTPAYTVKGISDWAGLDYNSIPIDLPTSWDGIIWNKEAESWSCDPATYDYETAVRNWNAVVCDWNASGYRLPTEMEWMWAAMGADQDARDGAMQGEINETGYTKEYAGEGYGADVHINDYARYYWSILRKRDDQTYPEEENLPNELGLYDMSKKEWELCWDWWSADGWPTGMLKDYRGADPDSYRILHGGGWDSYSFHCPIAIQDKNFPYLASFSHSFRVLRPV
jgi:formylglycine-generating enzyme required for sulfatase activity